MWNSLVGLKRNWKLSWRSNTAVVAMLILNIYRSLVLVPLMACTSFQMGGVGCQLRPICTKELIRCIRIFILSNANIIAITFPYCMSNVNSLKIWILFWEEIPVLVKLVLTGWSDMYIQIQWYINIWTQQYFGRVTFRKKKDVPL